MDTSEIIKELQSNTYGNRPLLSANPCSGEFILAVASHVYLLTVEKKFIQEEYLKNAKKAPFERMEDGDNPQNWDASTWKKRDDAADKIYTQIEYAAEIVKELHKPGLVTLMQETAKLLEQVKWAMLQAVEDDDFYAVQQLLAIQSKLCHEWTKQACFDEP